MNNIFSSVKKFFRRMEEKLQRHPVVHGGIGAVGVVLFWRGIWYVFDFIFLFLFNGGAEDAHYLNLLDGLISSALGFIMLMSTGLFVYDFIGAKIISSEIKAEEKVVEKTEKEEKTKAERLEELENKFEEVTNHLDEHLENIEKKLGK